MKKIIMFILIVFPFMVNADVQVNNDNLKEAYKLYVDSYNPDLKWDFENKSYTVIDKDTKGEHKANYEFINNGVKVKYSYNIYKGMTYDEAKISEGDLLVGSYMYMLVEKINGIDFEKGSFPAYLAVYGGELHMDSSEGGYIIYDDTEEPEEGFEITVECGDNQKCIPQSKYGNYAIEIAKFQNKSILELNGKTTNSGTTIYNYNIKTDTEDKYEIDCEMIINTDGSFDNLKKLLNNEENKDNITSEDKTENLDKDSTEDKTENPKTGIIDYILYLVIILFITSGLVIGIKKKNIFIKL